MTVEHFDAWYLDIARSGARQRLFTEALGVPEEVGPSNLVPLDGLHEVSAALRLQRGGLLVDLACGRGGPGMWIARESQADLVGVDFSAEAISQASARRALFGLQSRARFALGSLERTGLASSSADAAVCIDAFQFAGQPADAAVEIRRVLRPGGRVALTCWEPLHSGDEQLPERLRDLDLAASLTSAGFAEVERQERPQWYAVERRLLETAAALDPGDDPALASIQSEAQRSLPSFDRKMRVLVTATAPAD